MYTVNGLLQAYAVNHYFNVGPEEIGRVRLSDLAAAMDHLQCFKCGKFGTVAIESAERSNVECVCDNCGVYFDGNTELKSYAEEVDLFLCGCRIVEEDDVHGKEL